MDVSSKYLWRVALILILSVTLAANIDADQLQTDADRFLALAAVGTVAIVVVVVLVVREAAKKRVITGCVNSGDHGMTLTDEKDKHVYALSGDISGVKAGERMTLQGRRFKANGSTAFLWETKKVTKDFGVC
jgi:hypothetical protein